MRKIIIVDDEVHILNGLKNAVPWHEIDAEVIDTAASGEEALHKALNMQPDIVITDITMGGMDGLQLIEALRKCLPKTKVIILSGYAEFAFAQRAIELNACAYLLKPVLADELLAKVKELLGPPTPRHERSVIIKAEAYMTEHYADTDHGMADTARYLRLNTSYFSKLYKKETGRGYVETLIAMRIKKARRMLIDTNEKVASIASQVGYEDAKYFSTLFKRETGLSPVEYREIHGGRQLQDAEGEP